MRDNPNMTTWLLLGAGGLAAYYFYFKPRMEQAEYAASTGAPTKRDWIAEGLNVIIKGTTARQSAQAAAAEQRAKNLAALNAKIQGSW